MTKFAVAAVLAALSLCFLSTAPAQAQVRVGVSVGGGFYGPRGVAAFQPGPFVAPVRGGFYGQPARFFSPAVPFRVGFYGPPVAFLAPSYATPAFGALGLGAGYSYGALGVTSGCGVGGLPLRGYYR